MRVSLSLSLKILFPFLALHPLYHTQMIYYYFFFPFLIVLDIVAFATSTTHIYTRNTGTIRTVRTRLVTLSEIALF